MPSLTIPFRGLFLSSFHFLMNIILDLKLYTLFLDDIDCGSLNGFRLTFLLPFFTFFCTWLVVFGEEQQCSLFTWGGCFWRGMPGSACALAAVEASRSEALLFVGSKRNNGKGVFSGGGSREYDVFAAISNAS